MRVPAAVLLVASLAGILGLGLAAEHLAPPLVPLAELRHWEGRALAAEALVVRAHAAGAGAQVLRLADASGAAVAFWGRAEPVEGAWVRVEGAPERSRGQWELRAWRVEVLEPPGQPLGTLRAARLAPALLGQEVAVHGALRWPPDGEPALAEEGARLPLEAEAASLAGLDGASVLARGVVRYEAERARFVLHAWEVRRA